MIRCAAAPGSRSHPHQALKPVKSRPGSTHWINKVTVVKDVVTVVPTLLLSAVAVLGMAVLIGLSVWELPIRFAD